MYNESAFLRGLTHGPMIRVEADQTLQNLTWPVRLVPPSPPGRLSVPGLRLEGDLDANTLYKSAQVLTHLSSRLRRESLPADRVRIARSHYTTDHAGKPKLGCQTCTGHEKAFSGLPASKIPHQRWYLEIPRDLREDPISVFFHNGRRDDPSGNVILAGCQADRREALIGFGDEAKGYIYLLRAHADQGQGLVAPVARYQCILFQGLIIAGDFPNTSNNFFGGEAVKAIVYGALATYPSPEEGWRAMGGCLRLQRDGQRIAEVTPDNLSRFQERIRVPFSIESAGLTEGHPLLGGGKQPAFSADLDEYWPDHGVDHVLISTVFRS